MPEPVISVRNVSKAYRIWESPAARILSPLQARLGLTERAAKSYRDFWALQEVSFDVRQGEAVGIIGRNGSGKSTLLQIIAGTLQPTGGEVQVTGRVAALLELGSGFNPEFTGRENVYLSGTIRGLTRNEIDARFDAIAAFADIGDFVEQPVKTYSSGMALRLAFAVCAHVDASVLIIDEALGVGDARFQLKCARTIDRFIEEGRTLLFVSHDLNSVKRLCNRAALLEVGRILYHGPPNTVVNLYTKLMASNEGAAAIQADILELAAVSSAKTPPPAHATETSIPRAETPTGTGETEAKALRAHLARLQVQLEGIAAAAQPDHRADLLRQDERAAVKPATGEYSYGGELGTIHHRAMHGADGTEKFVFAAGESVEVRMRLRAAEPIVSPIYALTLKSRQGQEVYGTNTLYIKQHTPDLKPGAESGVVFRFPLNLVAGEYFLSLGWTFFIGEELVVVHRRYDTIKFTVLGTDRAFGIANCFATIEVTTDRAPTA